jgi:hypothetical protein
MLLRRAKQLSLVIVKWTNGLLFLFFAGVSLGNLIQGKRFKPLISLLGTGITPESILVPALGAAFLALRTRGDEAKRNLAKWANVAALGCWIYVLFRLWFGAGQEHPTYPEILTLAGLVLFLPLINLFVFWRRPATAGPSGPAMDQAATGSGPVSNHFTNHWHGRLPLGTALWVNGWLVIASVLAFQKLLDDGALIRNARTAAMLYAVVYVIGSALAFWFFVGMWRSAMRQMNSGRRPMWGALAQLGVLLYLFNQLDAAVWVYFPTAREHFDAMVGNEIVEPYQIQVSADGGMVELRGGLRFGSATAMERALAAFPKIKLLKIDSPGGRVNEAIRMMGMVRDHGLTTYATGRCMSAATLVLTAGKERGAAAGTRIGFHSARSPSGNAKLGDASMMGSLVSSGVSESFVRRVLSVPGDGMWFPSIEEMLEARVLTSYGVDPPGVAGKMNGGGSVQRE